MSQSVADSGGVGSSNLNENPLIAVSGGEVADFVLLSPNGLGTQISADLGRESVEWHRSFDQPLTVYLEATFVKLDVERHLISEGQYSLNVPQPNSKSSSSSGHHPNGHFRQLSTSGSAFSPSGHVAQHPILGTSAASSVKRNHSFNVIRRTDSSVLGRSPADLGGVTGTTTLPSEPSNLVPGSAGTGSGISGDHESRVNHGLVRLLASRFLATGGAGPVLLHSHWVELTSHLDLEAYHATVRQPLLDWFSRILVNSAGNRRLGLTPTADAFLLDVAIIVVINRKIQGSSGSGEGSQGQDKSVSSEQVLSLDRLIADQQNIQQNRTPTKQSTSSLFKTSFGLGSSSKTKLSGKSTPSSNLATSHTLSSSLTSLPNQLATQGSGGPHPLHATNSQNNVQQPNPNQSKPIQALTVSQLVEQMRNDLSVCYQLFQQKVLAGDGSLPSTTNVTGPGNGGSFTPPHPAAIVSQLMERMLVFDYSSNTGLGSGLSGHGSSTTLTSGHQSTSGSTMKQLSSALSNSFGSSLGGSIKIISNSSVSSNSSSIISSPSKSSKNSNSKNSKNLHYYPPAPLDAASLPVLTYSSLVARLRSLLLEGTARQVAALERQIRRQRELRTAPDWDFVGFFLLQEALALHYECLGLYGRALVQYDELDALFSQSVANAGATGGIGPRWLQRRILGQLDEDGEEGDAVDNDGPGGMLDSHDDPLGGRKLALQRLTSGGDHHQKSSLYSSWNGLCLCNPAAINALRGKIVHCVLADYAHLDHETEPKKNLENIGITHLSSPSSPTSPLGFSQGSQPKSLGYEGASSPSSTSSFIFSDPLGVNLGLGGSRYPISGRSPSSLRMVSGNPLSCFGGSPQGYGSISLIDFRNYLFARQCHLLCLLNKPWELASRALPFLQTTVAELKMLEISIAPGGIACWVFLSVLEILHKCERYSDSSQLESYSYHTVGLWAYARDKLAELGTLCSLMPTESDNQKIISGRKVNASEQLHRMVELVAGMGADPHIRAGGGNGTESSQWSSPQERLKSALSSGEAFLSHYLELTELTMGTYKHIGYIRSARLIGAQLARLYLQLGRPQQALPFLLDHYSIYGAERWSLLRYETARLLATCLEALYYSAFTAEDKPEVESENQLDLSPPAFNLEATARSAFRTFLLLLLKPVFALQIQLTKTTFSEDQQNQYLSTLEKLLQTYSEKGLLLREITEKLLNKSLTLGGEKDPLSLTSLPKYTLDYNRPLLAIHNSQSDLFYDSFTSSSTGSGSTLTLANSSTSLHRLVSGGGAGGTSGSSSSNASSKLRLNSEPAILSDGSLPGSVSNSPPPISGSVNLPSLSSSPPMNLGVSQLPSASLSPNSKQTHGPQLRKLDERFLRVVSLEITSSSSLGGSTSGSSSSCETSVRSDRSFIAGSRLLMKLVLQSELAVTIPLEGLFVTVVTAGPEVRAPGPEVGSLSRKRSTSEAPGSLSSGGGSTEQLDATETEIRLRGVFAQGAKNGHSHPHPYSIMETYLGPSAGVAGVVCRNVDYLLRWQAGGTSAGGGNSGHHGGLKFLPQLPPVSLLNQRLADDQNNFRHYRFLGAGHRFDLLSGGFSGGEDGLESSSGSLELQPGLNTFYLSFQSPEQFGSAVSNPKPKVSGGKPALPPKPSLFSSSQISGGVSGGVGTPILGSNQLWFSLDQLVLLCRLGTLKNDHLKDSLLEQPSFAIVEDFGSPSGRLNTISPLNLATNFRLVKCPPTVELMPITVTKVTENLGGSKEVKSGTTISPYTSLLIGVDTLVTLRLNSGTNVLPKGLKCFLKIAPVMPSISQHIFSNFSEDSRSSHPVNLLHSSIGDLKISNSPLPPQQTFSNFDGRLLAVSLHPTDKSGSESGESDEPLLFFHLDRQVEPFGTYELQLLLKSTYARPQVTSINAWALNPFSSNSSNFTSPSSKPLNSLTSRPASNSRDYQLTVSWTSSTPAFQTQNADQSVSTNSSSMTMMMAAACCTFTLYSPFHLYTKLHTLGGNRKLLEVGLVGSAELATGSRSILVRRPTLLIKEVQVGKKEITNKSTSQDPLGPLGPQKSKTFNSKISAESVITFKPMGCSKNSITTFYPLKPLAEQHFLWSLEASEEPSEDELFSLATLKRFKLELDFSEISEVEKGVEKVQKAWKTASYEVRLTSDLSTRYTVRESIEPIGNLIGTSTNKLSTELLRVGSSCLLRVSIEKVLGESSKKDDDNEVNDENDEDKDEDHEEEEEDIMYELVYDVDLWSLVVNSGFIPQNHHHRQHRRNHSEVITSSGNSLSTNLDSLGSLSSATTITSTTSTITSDYYSLQGTGGVNSGPESTRSTTNIEFNVPSKVLKLSASSPVFEAAFEMTPLADGYLPYPSVRLSRFETGGETQNLQNRVKSGSGSNLILPQSPTPAGILGSSESVGRTSSGDSLDGSGASKQGSKNFETTSGPSSNPLSSLSVKNWTQKLLSSAPSKSSSNTGYQSLGVVQTGSSTKISSSSTEILSSLNPDSANQNFKNISGRLVAFEPGQVYNYSRAAQIYVLPAVIEPSVDSGTSSSQNSAFSSIPAVVPVGSG